MLPSVLVTDRSQPAYRNHSGHEITASSTPASSQGASMVFDAHDRAGCSPAFCIMLTTLSAKVTHGSTLVPFTLASHSTTHAPVDCGRTLNIASRLAGSIGETSDEQLMLSISGSWVWRVT